MQPLDTFFIKFHIIGFYENFSSPLNLDLDRLFITAIFHEDPYVLFCARGQ
jgi:hypothetical protein